jgi:hypothetical protein
VRQAEVIRRPSVYPSLREGRQYVHAKSHRSVTESRTLRGGGPASTRFGMDKPDDTIGNDRFRVSPGSCVRAMPQPPATGGMSATSSPE